MESRSMWAICTGFVFWFLMAGFIYTRNTGMAIALGAATVAVALIWNAVHRIQERRAARPKPPPPSDLPSFDFKDVEPKDFE